MLNNGAKRPINNTGEQFFFHVMLHEIFQMILARFLTLIPNPKLVFVYML